ncbi:uncharacterized protein [Aquarana catesbeiana]|uniref:uncharacterized protein isoform X1 n=1 Tax=Aquarana catesbeiana TaxID=8400 RepID=UPI003CCA319E
MLRKLFRKSKAAEGSGGQKEVCSLPIWARDNVWEFVKYSSPLNLTWSDKVSYHFVDFSLKGLNLSKKEKRTVSTVSWYFLHAIYTESHRREKAEAEVKVLEDQLAVASECVCSTASQADALQKRCAALMTKSINALRKRKGHKPVSKTRVRAIVTCQNWDCEDVLSSNDSEDEVIEFDILHDDLLVGKKKYARPLITKHRKRQHDREDMADGEMHYRNPRDVEFEEVREFTQTELHELAKQYKQRSGEPLLSWLLRLWDEGADSVVLSGKEAVTMGVLTHDPQLCQAMQKAREFSVNFSLLDLVRDGIVRVYASPTDLENTYTWRLIGEGISRLREMGCITGLNTFPEWMGPDMEPFTSALRSKMMKSAPFNPRAPLLSLLVGLGLNSKINETTTLLSQLGELEEAKTKPVRAVDKVKARQEEYKQKRTEKKGNGVEKTGGEEKTRLVISRKEMWVDLLKAGVPKNEIDGISTAEMLKRWKHLVGKTVRVRNTTPSEDNISLDLEKTEQTPPVSPNPIPKMEHEPKPNPFILGRN